MTRSDFWLVTAKVVLPLSLVSLLWLAVLLTSRITQTYFVPVLVPLGIVTFCETLEDPPLAIEVVLIEDNNGSDVVTELLEVFRRILVVEALAAPEP